KKKEEKKEAALATSTPATSNAPRDLTRILSHARITEKASMHQGTGIYTFDISKNASKRDIMQAVRKLYGVTPRKIAVVSVPSKNVRSMRTGKRGVKSGGRKAYVYLKSGETITF
ncbi:MAG: 50S ribosomal protein L23, partial [Candidatus Kaiserbacteria bacterium]|nr:50S ribosomal protein L23 [Candidatus Kaiserbacteria bacterium]